MESRPNQRHTQGQWGQNQQMNSALFKFFLYCLKCMNASRWNKWPSFHPMRLVVFSRTRSAPIVKNITQLYCYLRHAWWHPESRETWWSSHGCACWLLKGFWHHWLCNHFEKNSPARFFQITPELDNQGSQDENSMFKYMTVGRRRLMFLSERGSGINTSNCSS